MSRVNEYVTQVAGEGNHINSNFLKHISRIHNTTMIHKLKSVKIYGIFYNRDRSVLFK